MSKYERSTKRTDAERASCTLLSDVGVASCGLSQPKPSADDWMIATTRDSVISSSVQSSYSFV